MSNSLQIEFDNPLQFPLLNAINEDLKKLIPQDLLYLESLYTTRAEKHFLSDGEKVAMFEPILNELKTRLTDTNYSVLATIITKLKRERDKYLAVNTTTSDRSYAIENYNSIVIEKVKLFSYEVFSIIVKVFRNYISDSNNAAALQKTDTSYCLEVWNKEFPTIYDAGNDSQQTTSLKTKLKPVLNTLQIALNENQKKTLYNLLIAGKYIKDTKEVDFIYWLSEKPLLNDIPKIKWVKKRILAMQLFKAICLGFGPAKLNLCMVTNEGIFDSNTKSKIVDAGIEEILQQVKK